MSGSFTRLGVTSTYQQSAPSEGVTSKIDHLPKRPKFWDLHFICLLMGVISITPYTWTCAPGPGTVSALALRLDPATRPATVVWCHAGCWDPPPQCCHTEHVISPQKPMRINDSQPLANHRTTVMNPVRLCRFAPIPTSTPCPCMRQVGGMLDLSNHERWRKRMHNDFQ